MLKLIKFSIFFNHFQTILSTMQLFLINFWLNWLYFEQVNWNRIRFNQFSLRQLGFGWQFWMKNVNLKLILSQVKPKFQSKLIQSTKLTEWLCKIGRFGERQIITSLTNLNPHKVCPTPSSRYDSTQHQTYEPNSALLFWHSGLNFIKAKSCAQSHFTLCAKFLRSFFRRKSWAQRVRAWRRV